MMRRTTLFLYPCVEAKAAVPQSAALVEALRAALCVTQNHGVVVGYDRRKTGEAFPVLVGR